MNLPEGQSLLLLHNPSCSKSRAALELLEASGQAFLVREYLQQPLDAAELLEVGRRLGEPLHAWVRDAERAQEAQAMERGAGDAWLAERVAENPSMMQRPILLAGERARIGRPTEALRELLP